MRVVLVSKSMIAGAYRRKAEALAALGVDVVVVVPPFWRDDAGRQAPLEPANSTAYRLVVESMAFNGHFHYHFYPHLGACLREARPDVVHVEEEPYNVATLQAFWLGHRLGARPLFFTWQNLLRRYPPPFRWIEQYCYRQAAGAIAGNAEAVDVLRRKGYTGRTWVIPQVGVDPQIFYRRHDAGVEAQPRPFTVGFCGRLKRQKGAHLLVEAVAALGGDARLEILGWGPEEARLRALAQAQGLAERFTIHPALPSERVPEFLGRLDTLVAPSLTFPNWKEQFGRVLMEAMACEVPVVGSDSGEIADVIGNAGLLFPEGDVAALTDCLRRLRDDADLRHELAATGLARAQARYTQAQIAAQTLEVYQAILAG